MEVNNISFKGINIAKTNVLGQEYKLYKLTEKDNDFLHHLYKTVDFEKILPKATKFEKQAISEIFKKCIFFAFGQNKQSYLITSENNPCGLLTYTTNKKSYNIDYVCTWPTSVDKKPPFACKTLFQEVYKNFLESDTNDIELYALRYSYGNPISKYLAMGFKLCGGTDATEKMKIRRAGVQEFLPKLKKFGELIPSNSPKDLNLFEELKIKR